jgi:hypothetical protein
VVDPVTSHPLNLETDRVEKAEIRHNSREGSRSTCIFRQALARSLLRRSRVLKRGQGDDRRDHRICICMVVNELIRFISAEPGDFTQSRSRDLA